MNLTQSIIQIVNDLYNQLMYLGGELALIVVPAFLVIVLPLMWLFGIGRWFRR